LCCPQIVILAGHVGQNDRRDRKLLFAPRKSGVFLEFLVAYCLLEQSRSFGATSDPLEEAAMSSQVVADESHVGAAKVF